MPKVRHYRDRCGVARALDLVGGRWALLVVRELLLGPKRFTDLRAGLPHIQPDVLSYRLRDLEEHDLIASGTLPPPSDARVYELTPRGAELEPVILALGRWGSGVPFDATMDAYGPDSAVLALKTLFSPAKAGALDAVVQLRLSRQPFVATIRAGALDLVRGSAEEPAVELDTDPKTLAAVLWHGLTIDDAIASERLGLRGSRRTAKTFLRLFPQ